MSVASKDKNNYTFLYHKVYNYIDHIQSIPCYIILLHGRIASRHNLVRGDRNIKHIIIA